MKQKLAEALMAYTLGFIPDLSDPEVAEFLKPHIDFAKMLREQQEEMLQAIFRKTDALIMNKWPADDR